MEPIHIVSVKNSREPLSVTCAMYLVIRDHLADVPERKNVSDNKNVQTIFMFDHFALVRVYHLPHPRHYHHHGSKILSF